MGSQRVRHDWVTEVNWTGPWVGETLVTLGGMHILQCAALHRDVIVTVLGLLTEDMLLCLLWALWGPDADQGWMQTWPGSAALGRGVLGLALSDAAPHCPTSREWCYSLAPAGMAALCLLWIEEVKFVTRDQKSVFFLFYSSLKRLCFSRFCSRQLSLPRCDAVLLECDKGEGQKENRMTVLPCCLSLLPSSQAGKYLEFLFLPICLWVLKQMGGCHQYLVQILVR